MFHFIKKRIEAHVCICFVAYKVYKELERILKLSNINQSVDKVLDIAKTITTIKIKLPLSGETMTKTMLLTAKHKFIAKLFNQNFWKNFQGDALSKSGNFHFLRIFQEWYNVIFCPIRDKMLVENLHSSPPSR
jgi:hypothetical protein